MNDLVRLMNAAFFAARVHAGQKRKGAKLEPYINHLAEVAALTAKATNGEDIDLVIAAWLHDSVEDQGVTPEAIEAEWGDDVARLVMEVTDDKTLPKHERKRLQVQMVARKSQRARILKLADKTSNVTALVESPPANWPRSRLEDYARWACDVVDAGCRGLNLELERKFDQAVAKIL